MKEVKLKPCPFCGENEQDITNRESELAIRCQFCGAYGPWADSVVGAKEEWNRREDERKV